MNNGSSTFHDANGMTVMKSFSKACKNSTAVAWKMLELLFYYNTFEYFQFRTNFETAWD